MPSAPPAGARTATRTARRGRAETPVTGDPLSRYWTKRDFDRTPEPRGVRGATEGALSFVIQKHDATRLHYDFRLELDGVLLSWAVPKGPSLDPADKRMAVRTEDHPLSYATFEGRIPAGQYGAGTVIVWDRGTWEPLGDPRAGIAAGKLAFRLHGDKLAGTWELVRMRAPAAHGSRASAQEAWLLFKRRDAEARPRSEYDVVTALPDSVVAKPVRAAPGPGAAAEAPDLAPARAPAAAPAPATASARAPATSKRRKTKPTTGTVNIPAGAVKAALPEQLSPQLATLATAVPARGDWVCEIKFDGYRILTRIEHGRARLLTRAGHDWTDKMPELARALEGLGIDSAWLDGEIVVNGANGAPDFNALQNAFDRRRTADIVYFLFDLPWFEGHDLRQVALKGRRDVLQRVLEGRGGESLKFSADFGSDAQAVLASACRMHLEGIVAKRADAPYVSRRDGSWVKLKCQRRQEFVVAGYTDRANASDEVGSLILGVHDADGRLVGVGSVGTGWNTQSARELHARLDAIETDRSPLVGGPKGRGRWTRRAGVRERWVEPTLVAEVSFGEWTPDAQIRHAVFVALRDDKPAREIVREVDAPAGRAPAAAEPPQARAPARPAAPKAAAMPKITHPERVVDPSTGLTKLDVVRYYESVAEWILPHLAGRPVSLVRGPNGIDGPLFFQKHGEKIGIPGIRELDPSLWPGHDALLEIRTAEALIGAAQMNVIELHTWNSTVRRIDRPDRMVFDLDPGENVAWPKMREAATLVRAFLRELGLASWLKTSGGKGLHVVVPLAARHDYETVKDFSQAIVQHLARTVPSRFVAKSGPANRVGKIFVDYLRNGLGATTATVYSARARPGLGVSMPVAWDELASLKSGAQWTIATAREHLSFQTDDPWAGYAEAKQALGAAMKALGFKPPAAKKATPGGDGAGAADAGDAGDAGDVDGKTLPAAAAPARTLRKARARS